MGATRPRCRRDSAGNLYGTVPPAAQRGAGVVYKLDTSGQETVLYSFSFGSEAGEPLGRCGPRPRWQSLRDHLATVARRVAGAVYKLDTSGNETVLYNFAGVADGDIPLAGSIRDSAGNLYGTT